VRLDPKDAVAIGALLFSPFAYTESDFQAEIEEEYEVIFCNSTFLNCADITASQCKVIGYESFSRCPIDGVLDSIDDLVSKRVCFDDVIVEVEIYASCFAENFVNLVEERGVTDRCLRNALEASDPELEERKSVVDKFRADESDHCKATEPPNKSLEQPANE
jgi:hypothetical protein